MIVILIWVVLFFCMPMLAALAMPGPARLCHCAEGRVSLSSVEKAALALVGLIGGSTLFFLVVTLLGWLLPGWPFNLFFMLVAVVILIGQTPYWLRLGNKALDWYRHGAVLGAIAWAGIWGFYCFG